MGRRRKLQYVTEITRVRSRRASATRSNPRLAPQRAFWNKFCDDPHLIALKSAPNNQNDTHAEHRVAVNSNSGLGIARTCKVRGGE